jgi:hypothetical protein
MLTLEDNADCSWARSLITVPFAPWGALRVDKTQLQISRLRQMWQHMEACAVR